MNELMLADFGAEELETLEAPGFWEGVVGIGVGIGLGAVALWIT